MENNSNGKFNWEFRRTVDKSYIYFCFKSPYAIGKQYKEKKLKVCEQNYKLIGIKRLSSGDYDTNKEGYNVFKKKKKRKKMVHVISKKYKSAPPHKVLKVSTHWKKKKTRHCCGKCLLKESKFRKTSRLRLSLYNKQSFQDV